MDSSWAAGWRRGGDRDGGSSLAKDVERFSASPRCLLPRLCRPNDGRSILASRWRCRSIGLLGCLEAFHSVSQLVSPSNLGSAYYFCSAAAALVAHPSKAIVVNKQLQRKNPLCDEKSSLCCGFDPHTTTCYFGCCRYHCHQRCR